MTGKIGRIGASEKGDNRVEASVGKGQEIVAILFPADINAFTAKHTAEWIVGEKGEVDLLLYLPFKEPQGLRVQTDLEVLGNADQLAATLDRTAFRVTGVGGHEEFEGHALKASHRWSISSHHQTLTDFLRARRYRPVKAINLHKTQSARGVRVFPCLNKTQVRDENGVLETSLENGLSLIRLDLFFVDNQFDHVPSYTADPKGSWRWRYRQFLERLHSTISTFQYSKICGTSESLS